MILQNLIKIKLRGSSIILPAHGSGGARAIDICVVAIFFAEMPEARARRKGGSRGEFRRARAFRRSEAEAVSSSQKRFAHFQTKGTKLDFVIFGKPKRWNARRAERRGSQGMKP